MVVMHRSGAADVTWYAVATAVFSCVASAWLVLHNKYVLDRVFPYADVLMLVQNMFTIGFILSAKSVGLLEPFHVSLLNTGDLISGISYAINVVAGLSALSFLSVPVFQALKRCTLVVSWGIELLFNRKPSTARAFPAVLLMLSATLFTARFDVGFTVVGYALALTSCLAQGGAFELGRRIAEAKNKGIWAVLLANSVVALVAQIIWLLFTRDMLAIVVGALRSPSVLFHLAFNSVSCMLLNYSIFLNCTVNSPLAHTVTGNVKTAAATLFSVFLFDTNLAAWGWLGILGNFLGAMWFGYIKLVPRSTASKALLLDDTMSKQRTTMRV